MPHTMAERVPALVVALGLSVVALISGAFRSLEHQEPKGSLASAAAEAKKRGLSSIVVQIVIEGVDLPLRDLAKMSSIVIATPLDRPPAQVVTPDIIRTWYALKVTDVLARRQAPSDGCSVASPRSFVRGSDEIAIPLARGTTTIDGVSVTVISPEHLISFVPGERFLLFGDRCPSGGFTLAAGELSVFQVTASGRLEFRHSEPRLPFIKDVLQIATVDDLKRWLHDSLVGNK
jgi:hypothetical protein